MQVLPSPELSKLVKHFLFIESETRDIKKFRLFPDGNTGIVFSFKNRLISADSTIESINYLPNSFIYGQIDNYKNIFCINETSLLIVVFHPYGLNLLLGKPANELINQIIDLQDLFGTAGEEVTDRLFESRGLTERAKLEDRVQIIQSFIVKILKRND